MTIVALVALVSGCADGGGSDRAEAPAGADASADPSTDRSSNPSNEGATTGPTATTSTGRPSPGCTGGDEAGPTNGAQRTTVEETTDAAGRTRTYRLSLPADGRSGGPAPLVLALHGALGSADEFAATTAIEEPATERGFVVVVPNAVAGSWDYGVEGPDDAFLTGLVDTVAQRHCVDLDRVHLVGMSLGAWKSGVTACAHPGRFASLVLVTVEVRPEGCEPLPVLAIHGTSDHIAPYGEGGDDVEITGGLAALSGARANVAAWAEGAGCAPTWAEERIEPDVVRWIYDGCPDGLAVELFTVEGGDHAWPGATVEVLPTTDAIDATALAVDWFERHARTGDG